MAAANTIDRQPATLADVWNQASLLVAPRVASTGLVASLVGVGGLGFDPARRAYSTILVVVACFAARSLVLQRCGSGGRTLRRTLDVLASVAAALLLLQVLAALLGHSVGLIRA